MDKEKDQAAKIRQLWRDPKFAGSFSGLENFKLLLKLDKDIDISREKLYNILKKDRNYILEMRKIKKKIDKTQNECTWLWRLLAGRFGRNVPF